MPKMLGGRKVVLRTAGERTRELIAKHVHTGERVCSRLVDFNHLMRVHE